MDINIIKIGDRVYHPNKFGYGIVKFVNIEKEIADVLFDDVLYGLKSIKISFLEISSNMPLVNQSKAQSIQSGGIVASQKIASSNNVYNHLKIGDHVKNLFYGEGIIVATNNKTSVIKFQKSGKEITLLNDRFEKIEVNIITDEELDDVNFESKFHVIPSNYSDQSTYSTLSKRLLTYFRKKYLDEGYATIKSYQEEDGEIGTLIIPSKGIIIFKLMETQDSSILYSPLFNFAINNKYEQLKKYYLDKFYNSKSMCVFSDSYKKLRYPIRFVFIFQGIDYQLTEKQKGKLNITNKNIFFKNLYSPFSNNDLFTSFESYNKEFSTIPIKDIGSIVERVIPENATLISISSKKISVPHIANNPNFVPITGTEREFSALSLDDVQIKQINETKPGHYLTLANPGTGKSVLLLSKAYRIQSIEKDNHVLITCYNRNLAQHHQIFSEISGLHTSNLHISTFHRFVIDVLKKTDPYYLQTKKIEDDYDNVFDEAVNRLEELIIFNKVQTKLNAIFIDEIQLFEPKWIDICYSLLDKEGKDSFFEMYGDINQDVKTQRSKGWASWQRTKQIPSLKGRVRKLGRNYRNTDLIANYLKCLILSFNDFLIKHGMPIDNETACLSSETSKKGMLKTKILLSPNNNVDKVIRVVQELVTKRNADYNDIAIIYPATKFGKYYKPVWFIQQSFEQKNIPYSYIHGEQASRLFECDGVVLSTIDSCLGLDFKYVILCGIHFWDLWGRKDEEGKLIFRPLNNRNLLFDIEAKYYFSEIGKKIYSACSRARDGLFIIDDLNSDSPIKKILRPTGGEKYFDEN